MTTNPLARPQRPAPNGTLRDQAASSTAHTPLQSAFMAIQPKGGTAKSTSLEGVVLLLFYDVDKQIWVIDCDLSNPDHYRAHHGELKCECIGLESDRGFTAVARRLSDPRITGPIVISTGAGLAEIYKNNLGILDLAAFRVRRRFVVMVPIDLDTDSVIHLQGLREAMPHAEFYVIRPRHFGRPEEFEIFNESDIGQQFLQEKRVIDLPAMPTALVRRFKTDRKSLISVMESDDIADRCTLETWLPHSRKALAPIIGR